MTENRLPVRKHLRLRNYDYAQNGAYFVTICTQNRAPYFDAPNVGADVIQTFKRYSTVEYTHAVKAGILPPYDKRIWQRGYHEHIIRNDEDFRECWKYIEGNPLKKDTTL